MSTSARDGITGPMSGLYDVFVDWPGRLGREMPGIVQRLRTVGARRVLDLGCGTGRHVAALLEAGFDAHGADVSEDMLARAREHLGGEERLHRWRMGEEPPASLREAAPFDAALAMGNVWPMLTEERALAATAGALRALVRPGGLVLLGLKAFAVRQAQGNPYLPLLRREHEGRVLWFVRFVDFAVALDDEGARLCDLHMSVLAGDAASDCEALHHRATRVRAWDPAELVAWFVASGFEHARVGGRLDDPEAPATGDDVYLEARVGG